MIFDLDGTLTRSEDGILNCVEHALHTLGHPCPDRAELRKFIGPPLRYSFRTYCGMDEEQTQEAVRVYRQRYETVGKYENAVYPGIRRLLRTLKAAGCYLAIATGKPEKSAQDIAAYFGLTAWLDRVVGPTDSADADKTALIRRALPEAYDEAVMVGDRSFDIEGGRNAGIRTIGVGYGYGTKEELIGAGCDAYADSVDDLIAHLCPGMTPPRGAFLSMEGLDGSGKSTQIRLLTAALERFGYEVIHSREPGGSPIGEKIRDLLLDPANQDMTPEAEALLYAAGRAQHVRQIIRPTVASGRLLLCDRFVDSSIAYQGGGRQLGTALVQQMNAPAVDGTLPDATVYLRLPQDEATRRRRAERELDRLEMVDDRFRDDTAAAYEQLIAQQPDRFVAVDATQSKEALGRDIADRVLARLAEMGQ